MRRRFELLLRMSGEDGQAVTPMAFIPAAETLWTDATH